MPWLRFTAPFNFRLKPTAWISYRAGEIYLVKQACAAQAIAAGKAELTARPQRENDASRPAPQPRRILSPPVK